MRKLCHNNIFHHNNLVDIVISIRSLLLVSRQFLPRKIALQLRLGFGLRLGLEFTFELELDLKLELELNFPRGQLS